jgi:hypothetical protein
MKPAADFSKFAAMRNAFAGPPGVADFVLSLSKDPMKRRDFIMLISSAAAWPLTARAQRSQNTFRIGFLASYTEETGKSLVGCFRKGLEQFG